MVAEAEPPTVSRHRDVRRPGLMIRAPTPPVTIGIVVVLAAALAALLWLPNTTLFLEGFLFVLVVPALVGILVTPSFAMALGGRFEFRRSAFLTLTTFLLGLPLAAIWRGAYALVPGDVPGLLYLATFLAGPVFWFRHLTLYGVSRPGHGRTVAVSILPVALYLVALYLLIPPSFHVLLVAIASLVIAFGCALWLLRASDRPMRREFQISGVALIRPLLDHVGRRDSGATAAIEAFFLRTAIPADLKVRLISFRREGHPPVTVALPTVHPGPFAALGASDLPRKFAEGLGPSAGTVFVPHTPSDHDLDLPSEAELGKVTGAARNLLASLPPPRRTRYGPLVSPGPDGLARAQILGDVALVLVTQAPAPTDDIPYSLADRIVREIEAPGSPAVALVDAHNSYVEGQGDIIYGTPTADKLLKDVRAAVAAAEAAAGTGPLEVGAAVRSGYSIGSDGIGPEGIRALVVRCGGRTSGYVVIDGNNLVVGQRAPILRALEEVVDVAEVLTTDNHVVHEVDGGINPVGERYPLSDLVRDAKEVLTRALADLAPAETRTGQVDVPDVRVLGPGLTARLLTSLGDTLSMFTNMFPATLLLLLLGTLLVTYALR